MILNNDAKKVQENYAYVIQLKGEMHLLDQQVDMKEYMFDQTEEGYNG